jgi:hypothetical protein
MADGVQHASYLSISSLAKRQLDDPGAALLAASDQLCVCRGSHLPFADRQALRQSLDSFFAWLSLDRRLI